MRNATLTRLVRHSEDVSMHKATTAVVAIAIALLLALPAVAAAGHGPDLRVMHLTFKPDPPRAIVEHNGSADFHLDF